jgi:hypothetical protein
MGEIEHAQALADFRTSLEQLRKAESKSKGTDKKELRVAIAVLEAAIRRFEFRAGQRTAEVRDDQS